jgi:hypothetical protein
MKAVVVKFAVPVASSVESPRDDALSKKVTVPVGIPPIEPDPTLTVSVTASPNTAGLGGTMVEDEDAWFTVCESATVVELALKLLSPPYVTVIGWTPAVSDDVWKTAAPPLSVPEPIEVPPSKKVTVPVGVPPNCEGVTVAVKVTVLPKIDGFVSLVTAVSGFALVTVCVMVLDALEVKLASPRYSAVIE